MNQERARLQIQADLDRAKGQSERNRLGQFATPPELATQIVERALAYLGDRNNIRFLDPAFGTGSFYSALRRLVPDERIEAAAGFEIDPHYGVPATRLWASTRLSLALSDFTKAPCPPRNGRFNLIVCNPPYVRHHHLAGAEKQRLRLAAVRSAGAHLSGLAGLYCYFMALSHDWLADDGIGAWLVPSEFMNVNYGTAITKYLLDQVALLELHRFSPQDVQFQDAIVSSAVVYFRKSPISDRHAVLFTFGGSLKEPLCSQSVGVPSLMDGAKWTRYPVRGLRSEKSAATVGAAFAIKRGIATGGNSFFVVSAERAKALQIPDRFLRPILPPPRLVREIEVPADAAGQPILSVPPRYLVDCDLDEDEVKRQCPALWRYFESGRERVAPGYLCRHRNPWYSQEQRPPAPIVCTYLGRHRADRSKPFRFLLNHSRATAPNVYLLLYPLPWLQELPNLDSLLRMIWERLNALPAHVLLDEGRVYGGGLHKLEPRELANVPLDLSTLGIELPSTAFQVELFEHGDRRTPRSLSADRKPRTHPGDNRMPALAFDDDREGP